MIRLTSYFDASGGKEHPVIIVAGYVSTVAQWNHFDREWRKVLGRREFDVPYFHMREFAHSVGVFTGWKGAEHRRRRFINALVFIISEHVKAGFACAIKKSMWDRINSVYQLEEEFGCPYALCGRDCVNKTYVWGRMKNYQDSLIGTVFESGDHGKGHLIRVVQEANKGLPMFECGKPDETNNHVGITPLQASDFASWELLKVVVSGKEAAPFDDLRVSLQKLSKAVPVSWTKYEPKDFEKLVELGNIKRRTGTRAVRNMDGDL